MLRFLDQTDNFAQRTFRHWPQHQHFHCAPKIDRSRQYVVSDVFFDRGRFAGQIGFITGGLSFHNFAIDGKLGARLDQQTHPGLQGLNWHFPFAGLVIQHNRDFRRFAE